CCWAPDIGGRPSVRSCSAQPAPSARGSGGSRPTQWVPCSAAAGAGSGPPSTSGRPDQLHQHAHLELVEGARGAVEVFLPASKKEALDPLCRAQNRRGVWGSSFSPSRHTGQPLFPSIGDSPARRESGSFIHGHSPLDSFGTGAGSPSHRHGKSANRVSLPGTTSSGPGGRTLPSLTQTAQTSGLRPGRSSRRCPRLQGTAVRARTRKAVTPLADALPLSACGHRSTQAESLRDPTCPDAPVPCPGGGVFAPTPF